MMREAAQGKIDFILDNFDKWNRLTEEEKTRTLHLICERYDLEPVMICEMGESLTAVRWGDKEDEET